MQFRDESTLKKGDKESENDERDMKVRKKRSEGKGSQHLRNRLEFPLATHSSAPSIVTSIEGNESTSPS